MNTSSDAPNLLAMLLIGALLGAVGQGIRVIIGLKKVFDDALKQQKPVTDLLEYKQLALSLVIGFGVGAVCGVLAIFTYNGQDIANSQTLLLFIAAGYTGTDFIEGFMKKYPDATGGALGNKASIMKEIDNLTIVIGHKKDQMTALEAKVKDDSAKPEDKTQLADLKAEMIELDAKMQKLKTDYSSAKG